MVRFAYLILAAVCGCLAGCEEVKRSNDVLQATVTVNGYIGQGHLPQGQGSGLDPRSLI